MEDTVKVLEAMFKKAECDLDYIARKVDAECTNLAQSSQQINPAEALKRLEDVKREYAAVVQEAQAIQDAQKEAMLYFRGELVEMVNALTALQPQSPQQMAKSEEAAKLERLLGVTFQAPGAIATESTTTNPSGSQSTSQPTSQRVKPDIQTEGGDTEGAGEASKGAGAAITPEASAESAAERRTGATECIEVTESEFNGVSQLIRGRVKLAEVNQIYRILWHHFKEAGKSGPLTTQQMYKMGLRVTGHTGEAKLKVLRELKLLTLSKKGEVNLL